MSKSKIKIKKTKDEKNAIAIIRGGLYDGQYVSMEPYDNDNEQTLKINNLNDYVSNKTIKEYTPKYGMNLKHLFELEQAFKSGIAPNEYSSVKNTYDKIKPIVENKINNRIIINDGTFEIIPRLEKNQRDAIFIAGSSGSGKSTFAAGYAKNYQRLFPDNQIIIISKLDSDEVLDNLPNTQRLLINEDLIDIDIDYENDFSNCLVLIDDIDTINDKKLYNKVKNIRDSLLETSRHYNTYIINIVHMLTGGQNTKSALLECNKIVIFTKSNLYQNKRFLKEYMGFDSKKIKEIFDNKSRWVCINKTYPVSLIYEHQIDI